MTDSFLKQRRPPESGIEGLVHPGRYLVKAPLQRAKEDLGTPEVPLISRAAGTAPSPMVALTKHYNWVQFENPGAVHWPGLFWMWNVSLEPEVLKSQLRDMAVHGFRSVCALPLPHAFRPDSTNNELEPDYLTPDYHARVRYAADIAAELHMNWWLYDEGGWPSGQAAGKVTEAHPGFLQQTVVREPVTSSGPYIVPGDALALIVEAPAVEVFLPGATWTPASGQKAAHLYRVRSGGYADLMNPEATRRFIEITHDSYKASLGHLFGGAIRFTFTDEPNCPNLHPPDSITWTQTMDRLWTEHYGGRIFDAFPTLFTPPSRDISPDMAQTRIQFYDLWTGRFRDAYFMPLRDWCRAQGLASGGHLNGEEETPNAVRYGFGHALRQLRALDVPGVDVIWRQLFPGKPDQHFFPKYASSAAHQNGLRYAFTESFCVYGNGITPAQMKWIQDYQCVRGLNLLVMGCFPLGTREHHMTGERPHFGPMNPLWDHLYGFTAYVSRLGYALSCGTPRIGTALYYPVRDLWAWGESAVSAVETHDLLAAELLANQCDFDLIDDDLLADPASTVNDGKLQAGAMRYHTIVVGDTCWMQAESLEKLKAFAASGGRVCCVGHAPGSAGFPGPEVAGFTLLATPADLVPHLEPTVRITPACRDLRAAARATTEGDLLFLFNEGAIPYAGSLDVSSTRVLRLDPQYGSFRTITVTDAKLPLSLLPGESLLLWTGDIPPDADPEFVQVGEPLMLDSQITVKPHRRWSVGDHDFETAEPDVPPVPFHEGAAWKDWLGAEYSGEVDYEIPLDIPETWAGVPLRLETGPIEYAATVLVDGAPVGQILWAPWRMDLPPLTGGPHHLALRVANTLANELTSQRVADAWSEKSGPGWPSPYHERALAFEQESRGGGLQGPVTLTRIK